MSKQQSINSQRSRQESGNKFTVNSEVICAEEVKNSSISKSSLKESKILDDDKSFNSQQNSIKNISSKNGNVDN